ncbi:MAG: ATP-grasp domain-containing protein [Solirubrobacteraceae bacterium]
MSGRVGVLHHPVSHSPVDILQGIGGSAEVVWLVVDGEDGGRVPRRLLEHMGDVIDLRNDDPDAAAAALSQAGVEGIVTFRDEQLRFAAQLAELLGLPFLSPAVAARLRNKYLQRQALRAGNVAQPDFWHLPNGLNGSQLDRVAAAVRYPAMVKPVEGAGSQGVTRVDSPAQLLAAYRADVEQLAEKYMPDTESRDQRFGSYVAVESVVSQGVISHLAVIGNGQLADGFRETISFLPAALEAPQREAVLDLATAALTVLKVKDSVTHTEVKLSPEGPKIIEVNGRAGGASAALLGLAAQFSLFRVAAEVALGLPQHFDAPAPTGGVGFWWDCNPPLGATRVLRLSGVAQLAGHPDISRVVINAREGQTVDPLAGTFGVVTLLGHTECHDDLITLSELIERTISIDYEFNPALMPTRTAGRVSAVAGRKRRRSHHDHTRPQTPVRYS